MNKQHIRNLTASIVLAPFGVMGLFFALFSRSSEVVMGFGVIIGLALLGGIELYGASRQHPMRQRRGFFGLNRSAKSRA